MSYLLGIDIGTSSVKSLIMKVDGTIIGSAHKNYDIKKEKLSYAEQDMDFIWESTVETLCELNVLYKEEMQGVQGISYSGQMHGLVLVDRDGELVRDAIIWADQRSADEIAEIYEVTGKDRFRNIAMNSLSTGFAVTSLVWVKNHEPANFEKARYVMFPKDYIRYKMCGNIGTEMSDGSSGGIFDVKNRDWSWELIDELKLPREIFGVCNESYEVAGTVTKECARKTGLKEGIIITYGGGDTMMQGVGNGIVKEGVLASNIGTASQISTTVTKPLYDAQFRTNTFCHVTEESWLLMGAHLSGGVALKWLMNEILKMDSYNEMTALASQVEAGSEGLLFLPYLSGERTPYNDPNAKGIYAGFTLKHSRNHMIRSTMEGIIFTLKNSLEILESLGVSYEKIIASGGGARGRLFLEMQADIFDREIYTNQANEQACVGACITAGIGCGIYKNYEQACGQVVALNTDIVIPNKATQNLYQEQYERFKELYPNNSGLFK